jgi:iron complex outermembrane recepter protein
MAYRPTLAQSGIALFLFILLIERGGAQSSTESASVNANGMEEAERVIVTGSNIPTAAEVGPNPVDTYRRDDITRLGVRTPTDFVEHLPAAFGFTVGDNTPFGGFGATAISLRGIDPKETLILQDGRRLAANGLAAPFVDFNVFPLGLIDHVDVLKDGASPVYGADAVAGVVNVFLIHKFRGLEVYASYGNTNLGFANDMGQETAYLLAGAGDEKTDIVVYAGIFNEAGLFARDVDVEHDVDHRAFGGVDGRSGNFAGRVTDFVYQPSLNGGAKTPTPHAYPNVQSNPQYVPRASLPPEQQLFNFAAIWNDIAPTDREYLYGSVTRDICDKYLTVFADFKSMRQFVDVKSVSRPFDHDIWTDADHPFGISPSGISVPIQNAFNPFTVADYVSPGGVNPQFPRTAVSAAPAGTAFTTGVRFRDLQVPFDLKQTTKNYVFTGGLKGTLGEFANAWDQLKTWQWEAGVRWNEDFRTFLAEGVFNSNALRDALLDTNPVTAFNPFGLSQNSRSVLNRVVATTHEKGWATVLSEDLKLNGDLFNLPGGPLSFAVGTEHMTNKLSDIPDGLITSGQTIGSGNYPPLFGTIDSWSQYWELRIPITGPDWNIIGARSVEIDYAERYENFSDFGETERPKFSIRWQPFGGSPAPLTLRAAYIEAFHSPTVLDLFGGTTVGASFIRDPFGATDPNTQVRVDFTSNPSLLPEIAYERTFGGVLTPEVWSGALHGLTVSVDYGHIDIRGFETFLDPQFVVDHPSEFPGLVQRDPAAGNRITLIRIPVLNLGRFIETYIDYEAVETFETARLGHGDWGIFTATFNGTYLADVDVQAVPNGKRTTAVGKFGGGFQGVGGGGNYSHNRWYASLFYDGAAGSWMRGIEAGAIVHYIGQYWDNWQFTIDANDRKVREWTTLDLILSYTFNTAAPVAQTEVAGYSKTSTSGNGKNLNPAFSAEYNPCGWRAWFNNMTLTFGLDNVLDEQPPFVAAAAATGPTSGFDQASANAKGRFWYVGLKKRF